MYVEIEIKGCLCMVSITDNNNGNIDSDESCELWEVGKFGSPGNSLGWMLKAVDI